MNKKVKKGLSSKKNVHGKALRSESRSIDVPSFRKEKKKTFFDKVAEASRGFGKRFKKKSKLNF